MTDSIEEIIQQSMKDNRNLLAHLGREEPINLSQNPDSDLLQILSDLMPKSTAGKIAVAGGLALVLWLALSKK